MKMKFTEHLRLNDSEDKVQPKTKDELKKIIEDTIEDYGYHCDLNFIDTSKITDMSGLFCYSKFNGDISGWDVSNVRNMENMFYKSKFNGDISRWNTSNVMSMHDMFNNSVFNRDISGWDVSSALNVFGMFEGCKLEKKPEFKPKF